MSNAFTYLIARFFINFWGFIRHWYVDGFWAITRRTINILENLDRNLALKITLRNFFKPLYQDYTIPGHVFGFFFRSARVIIASVSYALVVLGGILIFVIWISLPFYILALGVKDYL